MEPGSNGLRQVIVTPAAAVVLPDQMADFMAVGLEANGDTAAAIEVGWSTSGGSIAVTSRVGGRHYARLRASSVTGSYMVVAMGQPGGRSDTAEMTVTSALVASVSVSPATAGVSLPGTVQLTATPRDAAGNALTGRPVTWASNSTTIATVSSSGLVTGRAAGTATVTATSEGKSGSASVSITQAAVASVSVTPASATLQTSRTAQLTATPKDASGTPLSGRVVTWSSDYSAVATVNGSGLVTGVAAGSATISASSEGETGTAAITVTAPPPPGSSVVLVGAGDIADCSRTSDDSTAALIVRLNPDAVFTTGDNVYEDGTAAQFASCYDPSWGRFKAITRPAPGNHDYHVSGAADYYQYFGALAGEAGKGYYSYDLGDWHIISLNGEISAGATSAQTTWLKADLAATTKQCTIAYIHRPRFSAGYHGSNTSMQAIWQALYDAGAEMYIAGHNHDYERFAPMNASGAADPARGIRQFVVGLGGAGLSGWSTTPPIANLEVWQNTTYGVLKLTLEPGAYHWEFIPVTGGSFTDSGSGTCH